MRTYQLFLARITSLGADPADSPEVRLRKSILALGSFLMVGVIGVMLAVVANIFLASPVLHLTLCGAFVLLSSMLILYQLNPMPSMITARPQTM